MFDVDAGVEWISARAGDVRGDAGGWPNRGDVPHLLDDWDRQATASRWADCPTRATEMGSTRCWTPASACGGHGRLGGRCARSNLRRTC